MLLEDAEKHHVAYASRPFWRSLVDGMNWLKKALEILGPCNDNKRFDLSDVKETLRQYKVLVIILSSVNMRLVAETLFILFKFIIKKRGQKKDAVYPFSFFFHVFYL